jgi:DNA repair protein RecO (recombination protein O)
VEAIVLKHSDFGEADRLLTLYSRELGKLRALAKGARKPGSRKGGHLEPFSQVRLLIGQGRDLAVVSQAEAVTTNSGLTESLEALGYASYVVELLDKFSQDHDENSAIYRLLRDTLVRLTAKDDLQLAVRYYEVRLLDQVGFRPELQVCADCRKIIEAEDQYFSFDQGGVLCPSCGSASRSFSEPSARSSFDVARSQVRPISLGALKVLRHLQRSTYEEARRAKPNPAVQTELEGLMNAYVTHLVERSLNTPGFLRRVRKQRTVS